MNPELYYRIFNSRKEASMKLIDPVKSVVREAMDRLEEGSFDNFGRGCVVLLSKETNRIYRVSKTPKTPEGQEGQDCGLFVRGLQLDEAGIPTEELLSIQLPSDPGLVTRSLLFSLRGIKPKDMRQLAEDIGLATAVELSHYEFLTGLLRNQVFSMVITPKKQSSLWSRAQRK